VKSPLAAKTIPGTPTKVMALISVATMEPVTAGQGSERPARKKSFIVACDPRRRWPIQVVSAR
jgi:hypothetical protein